MYVLDTNTVIYAFKGSGRVATRLLSVRPSEVAIPTVVVYELEAGIQRSRVGSQRRQQLDALVASVRVLPFGLMEARTAAATRRRLEQAGRPIGPLDMLIAASALAIDATLVTHNVREFGQVPGLAIEDWY